MNKEETGRDSGTKLTQPGSRPVHYELLDKDGQWTGEFTSVRAATFWANYLWPDQEQDEDRTGKGWDVQVVG